MWGSDYPHHEGSAPFSRERLRRSFTTGAPTISTRCSTTTAADVYGFDLSSLEKRAGEVGPTVAELQVPLEKIPQGRHQPRVLPVSGWPAPR